MRKVAVIILVLLAVVIIAALALPAFLDVNRYHDRIQTELQKKLNRQVSLGPMHLSLLPLAFRVENAVIGDDPDFRSPRPFAQAEELYVTAKLMPLLHGDVQMDSLELRTPRIELIRNAQGTWNFSSLGHKATASTTAPAAPPQQAPQQPQAQPQPQAFIIRELTIRDGQVALTDLQKRQARAVYDHIDLSVGGYEPGKAFDIALAAHLPGQGAQRVQLSGRAGPIPEGALTAMPFDGTFKLDQVSLAAAQRFLNTQALTGTDAIASGDAKVRNHQGKLASSGSLKLENARVHGTDIGYPIALDYDLSDDLNSDAIHIAKGDLKLGSTPLSISGTLNTRPTPSQVDLRVNASNVSIDEAARLAAAFGVAFDPGMKISGKLNADIHAQGAATKPELNGTLSAQGLNIAGKDLPSPVQVQAIELALSPQAIRSNEFTASTGSTSLTARFTLSDYASPSPKVDLGLRTANARLAELINIAKAYGVSAVQGMAGSGTVALDLHATGLMKDMSAMNFSGNGGIQGAALNTPQITKPLLVQNANLRFTQNSVVLENFKGSLGSTNATGTLTLRNFSAPQVQFTLSADRMIVAEWQQMFPSVQPAPQKTASLSLVPPAYAAGAEPSLLARATGAGTLTIGAIHYDQLVLTNARSNVTLDRGLIRLEPITAELYGGTQSGAIVVDTRPTPSVYTVSTRMNGVDANKLLSSVSSLKQTLYGLLAANSSGLSFSGSNADQMARSLNGRLDLNLTKGRLAGIDVMHQLSQIARFVGGGAQPVDRGFTNLVQLTGNFDVRNGVAQTNNLKAVLDGGTLGAVGAVNLADQSLNMHVTAVLSKAMSDTVGGTQIGGFMNTALANNKGELVIPIIVTGTFQHPGFAPDLEQIAQMKLRNIIPTMADPGAMTGILGTILGGQKGQQTSGKQGRQPGGLEGILGTITGQPQPPAQQQPPQQTGTTQPQQPQKKTGGWQDILGAVLGGQQQQSGTQQQQQQQQQQNQQQNQQQQQRPAGRPPQQPQ
ncbi:MAG TPA: AsmA family protein [Terriglobales bacterium]|nr:AsmA family protein [Terriglobales bacterium]